MTDYSLRSCARSPTGARFRRRTRAGSSDSCAVSGEGPQATASRHRRRAFVLDIKARALHRSAADASLASKSPPGGCAWRFWPSRWRLFRGGRIPFGQAAPSPVHDRAADTSLGAPPPEAQGAAPNWPVSPDGRHIVFVAARAKTVFQLSLRPVGSARGTSLQGTEGATFPFWSPDSPSSRFSLGTS